MVCFSHHNHSQTVTLFFNCIDTAQDDYVYWCFREKNL
jgi:hypothetical protein